MTESVNPKFASAQHGHHPPPSTSYMRDSVWSVGCMPLLGCGVPGLFDRQFRHIFIFVLLDQDADYLHQRGERVLLIFPDFVN